MTKPWTVQCAYMSHVANTVTVEADTLEEALEKAIEAANEDPAGWKSTDHVTDSYVDACCEGADADPWGDAALPVPHRFTERGEPPVVTLTGPVPPGAVEVSGGRVLVRIATEAGTVTSEVRERRGLDAFWWEMAIAGGRFSVTLCRCSRRGQPVSRNGDSRVRSTSSNGSVSVTATHAARHRRSCPIATDWLPGGESLQDLHRREGRDVPPKDWRRL